MLRLVLEQRVTLCSFCSNFRSKSAFHVCATLSGAAPDSIVDLFQQPGQLQKDKSVPIENQELLQVGIVGAPNAGKSTVTNCLAGTKVTAVSHKTNTTAYPTLGAFTEGTKQVVLYDTPGIVHTSNYKSVGQAQRVQSAWSTATDCDLLMFVLDTHRQIATNDPRVLKLVQGLGARAGEQEFLKNWDCPPSILLLNKCDMLHKRQRATVPDLIDSIKKLHTFQDVFLVSALKGQGMEEVRKYLLSKTTPGEWTLEAGQATDKSMAGMALEMVKEKIFAYCHQELPYELNVRHERLKELADGSVRIEQTLVVANQRLKAMVVGDKGAVIGRIGIAARIELEKIFNRRVHLFIKVAVGKSSVMW